MRSISNETHRHSVHFGDRVLLAVVGVAHGSRWRRSHGSRVGGVRVWSVAAKRFVYHHRSRTNRRCHARRYAVKRTYLSAALFALSALTAGDAAAAVQQINGLVFSVAPSSGSPTGTSALDTFNYDCVSTGTQCSMVVELALTGGTLVGSANPLPITFGSGVTLPGFASTPTVNLGTLNGAAQDGTDNSGVSQPASGAGIRGWLSAIYSKLTGTLSVSWSGQSVTANLGTLNGAATAANQTAMVGATGSAPPANAIYVGADSGGNLTGLIQPSASAAINVSTATTTQLVALASGKAIYVTSWDATVSAAATANAGFQFEYGTGASCGTGTTPLTGPYVFAAGQGVAKAGGLGVQLFVPAGNALCVVTTAAQQISGSLAYTQF